MRVLRTDEANDLEAQPPKVWYALGMRKTKFAVGEFYHIYNRGVDKRTIFEDPEDLVRFIETMEEFNREDTVGSLFEAKRAKAQFRGSTSKTSKNKKLVNFVAYCLNQNHYHFILEPLIEDGIQKFMHKLSTGYTMYFNEKNKRSGSLFQGRYKSIHVHNNDYLLHLSVYVNLNDRVHKNLNKPWMAKFPFSSFDEFVGKQKGKLVCSSGIILEQFSSRLKYKTYAEDVLPDIIRRKESEKELKLFLFE